MPHIHLDFLLVIQNLLFLILVSALVLLPAKKLQKKKWYYGGAMVLAVSALLFLFANVFAVKVACYFNDDAKCGLSTQIYSVLFGYYFLAVGIAMLIKKRFFT